MDILNERFINEDARPHTEAMLEEKFWPNGVVSDLLKEKSGQGASNIYCGAKYGLFEGQCE